MSEIKDRLTKFLEYKGYGQLKFENTAGLGRGFVNKVGFNINAKSLEKIAKAYPELNIDWLRSGHGSMLNGENGDSEVTLNTPREEQKGATEEENTATWVLLLPVTAQGGSLNDFVVSVRESECEKVVSPTRGVDFAMTVSGDSMSPEYPNGSRIFIKRINERAFYRMGKGVCA